MLQSRHRRLRHATCPQKHKSDVLITYHVSQLGRPAAHLTAHIGHHLRIIIHTRRTFNNDVLFWRRICRFGVVTPQNNFVFPRRLGEHMAMMVVRQTPGFHNDGDDERMCVRVERRGGQPNTRLCKERLAYCRSNKTKSNFHAFRCCRIYEMETKI